MIVVDASIMVKALAYDGPLGSSARAELAGDERWAAPEHWKVEVFSSIRGLMLGNKITEGRARQAVDALAQLTVAPVAINDLLGRMWELRGNVTGYDAAYVAAAELHDATLITADARLAKASGPRCDIRLV